MAVFYIVSFLGSFLLFQLELIIAKMILPYYGGSYYVWTTCMVFFTSVLFLGYAFVDQVFHYIKPKIYVFIHLFLLLLACATFPFQIGKEAYATSSVLNILVVLTLTIGPVFFLLSMTSPLIQKWLALSKIAAGQDPYFLYSASNWGSMIGLLSFPFLFEAFLDVGSQLKIWYGLFVIYGILLIFCRPQKVKNVSQKKISLPLQQKIYWLALSASGVALMLVITSIITSEIGSIPLLWIIPLCIYLFTLVLNFKRKPWYPATLRRAITAVVFIWTIVILFTHNTYLSFLFMVMQYFVLFLGCMICHRKLYLAKPGEKGLTQFYFYMGLGGFVGSLIVCIGIPAWGRNISNAALDYAVAISLFGIAFLIGDFNKIKRHFRENFKVASSLTIGFIFCLVGGTYFMLHDQKSVYSIRNFYGHYRILDINGVRNFIHGVTIHGRQYLDVKRRFKPISYFHHQSPVANIFKIKKKFKRVGVLGLGIGSLILYSKKGQDWDFYEIDPDVVVMAKEHFSHLEYGEVLPKTIVGDGRLALEKVENGHYDVLFMDAFSSDSIPTHLITKEAINIYLNKVDTNGLIVFNITNRYLDLKKVLVSVAKDLKLSYTSKAKKIMDPELGPSNSEWFVISRKKEIVQGLIEKQNWINYQNKKISPIRVWTDSYVNILAALRY